MSTKMVCVIRKDLKMRRGKEIAQAGHSFMAFMAKGIKDFSFTEVFSGKQADASYKFTVHLSREELDWFRSSFKKVTLQVNSEEELLDIEKKTREAGLEVHLVTDSGATEFHGVLTNTCLAIGPHEESRIDAVTSHLKLY